MRCKCIHSDVCKHRYELQEAFKGIIEPQFGGRNPKYNMVDELIKTVCRYRSPRVEEHGAQHAVAQNNKRQ